MSNRTLLHYCQRKEQQNNIPIEYTTKYNYGWETNYHLKAGGWKQENNRLIPVTTEDLFAPDEILNLIFCKCKTGCGPRCGCRKAALRCTNICHSCHGECLNATQIIIDEEEDQEDLDLLLPDEAYPATPDVTISRSIQSIIVNPKI